MTSSEVRSRIRAFLESKDPAILVLRGGWGVGKTYLWRQALKEAKVNRKLWPELYAYASLFGVSSSDQLKETIALSYMNPSTKNTPTGIGQLWKDLKTSVFGRGKEVTGIFHWSLGLAFQWVKDTLVCLDDIERRGATLDIREVLGIVSILKDERNCKIVLILNDQALDANQKADFSQAGEKLFDIHLELSPSAEEAISYVFQREQPNFEDFLSSCQDLSVNNIRTIQRIGRSWQELKPNLRQTERSVVTRIIRLLVLLTWAHYEGGSTNVPDLDYVKDFNLLAVLLNKDKSSKQGPWDDILRNYGFAGDDETTQYIANLVQYGIYNTDSLGATLREASENALFEKKRQQHYQLWDNFHNSFDSDDELFISSLSEDFSTNARYLSLGDLQSAARVLRDMGRNDSADHLIDAFISTHPNNKFDISIYGGRITDSELLKRVEQHNANLEVERDLSEIIKRISARSAWAPEDIEFLASCSTDDYYRFFKAEHSPNLKDYVTTCLRFGQLSDNSNYKIVGDKAKEALLRIASESPLNKVRVSIIYGLNS